MGGLAGFRYREIVKRLKEVGLQFDRQARGSHEIWFNPATKPLHHHPQPPRRHTRGHAARHPQADWHRVRRVLAEEVSINAFPGRALAATLQLLCVV